ncbi:MAG: helix-turn-helix transcriptional regulator [Acidimicrobiales bacterium]|nr:helix-turn-helix transcriptional regulator [Acidimicrobiales bacterium]
MRGEVQRGELRHDRPDDVPEEVPDEVFDALADPTRRRLLDEISSRGPISATHLAAGFPVTRQAVVKHLSALSTAGLLSSDRHGREVLYAVVPGRLQQATAWLDDVGRRWDDRLAALVEHLSPPPPA